MKRIMIATGLVWLMACQSGPVEFKVSAGKFDRENCVVSAALPDTKSETLWTLSEYTEAKRKPVPSQKLKIDGKTVLCWILSGQTKAGEVRTFVAEPVREQPAACVMTAENTGQSLILKNEGRPVLQYRYGLMEPPEGVDSAYRRGGFIHPAWSPAGNVLTRSMPDDHHHHLGIWNPWTRILYGDTLYDLWNLGLKQGTVRAGALTNITEGSVCSGCDAALEHVIYTPEGEKTIMKEIWKLKTWHIPDAFLWDFESCLHPSTPLPVLLKAYRYAGFGYRATAEWTKENCEMHTSEGKTRPDTDGTTARWIYITGDTRTGRSGLLFMGHPGNYNAPEPLRIWDSTANNGRGDAFINFAPTKTMDWELKAGGDYVLRYRVLSYDGEMTPDMANRLWNDFAYPPTVEFF